MYLIIDTIKKITWLSNVMILFYFFIFLNIIKKEFKYVINFIFMEDSDNVIELLVGNKYEEEGESN